MAWTVPNGEELELKGADYCRGYIQNWLEGAENSERSAQRIFTAADKILRAGRAVNSASSERAPRRAQ